MHRFKICTDIVWQNNHVRPKISNCLRYLRTITYYVLYMNLIPIRSNPYPILQIMAVYDLIVMLGCLSLYSLPDLWTTFDRRIYPHLMPWLVPIVQIAMMTSVYCTIVMSFERYVRICHLCQLKSFRMLTEENFWWVKINQKSFFLRKQLIKIAVN